MATNYGVSWHYYPLIWAGCKDKWVADGVTTGGTADIEVPPGDYLLIGVYDEDGYPPDYDGNEII